MFNLVTKADHVVETTGIAQRSADAVVQVWLNGSYRVNGGVHLATDWLVTRVTGRVVNWGNRSLMGVLGPAGHLSGSSR